MIVDPLPCRALVDEATDWLEGELAAGRRLELELHLATCAGCLAYVEQLRQTRQALSRLDDDSGGPPSGEVRSNLLAMFRQRTAGH